MSKVLVVVYSWTGTGRRLAGTMAVLQHWPIGEIRDTRPRTQWRCVVDSLLHRRPAIRYEGPDPRDFDAVVLISPIWAGRLAGPMRSFVAERAASLPDLAVISVMRNRAAPAALVEISRLTQRAPVLDAAFTSREVNDGAAAARLQAFGKAVLEAEDRSHVVPRPATWSPHAA